MWRATEIQVIKHLTDELKKSLFFVSHKMACVCPASHALCHSHFDARMTLILEEFLKYPTMKR